MIPWPVWVAERFNPAPASGELRAAYWEDSAAHWRGLAEAAEAELAKLRKAGPIVVADAERWFRIARNVSERLEEMELHDDTGDPYDAGYMRAVREMQAALKGDEAK